MVERSVANADTSDRYRLSAPVYIREALWEGREPPKLAAVGSNPTTYASYVDAQSAETGEFVFGVESERTAFLRACQQV